MELEQLRQFSVIAREESLQAAATQLHLSPSALSRSVRKLEAELGQPLFDRTKNSLRLNDRGQLALEHARAILAEEQRLRDDFSALARRARTIRVESVAPAPTWHLSAIALAADPTAIIEPDMVTESGARSDLLNGVCDLAITARPIELPTVRSVELLREDLYANVPQGHALHDRETLSFSELDGQSFLVYGGIGYWHEVHERMLPNAQFVIQPDRTIFLQQLRTSKLLTFTTNAPENTSTHETRKPIPISDPEAHATFWLNARADAPEQVGIVFDLVRETNAECLPPETSGNERRTHEAVHR
ncbi:MAG: LysR family transcriptional regulator [Coriobacteriales bacterium]|nr:LysR family transcriptional regulator [Coriobacteriales bacterium]